MSPSLVAVVIPDGAHHLDLRAVNPRDPRDVIEARDVEVLNILHWVKNYTYSTQT